MYSKTLSVVVVVCTTLLLSGCFRPLETQQPAPVEVEVPEQPQQLPEPELPTLPVTTLGTGSELVDVTQPIPNSVISSPLEVTGEAPGYWFFEATAPIILTNRDGLIVDESFIQAQGNWMTTGLVSFSGLLTYTGGTSQLYPAATLILKKNNASGLPQHDASVEIPLLFY